MVYTYDVDTIGTVGFKQNNRAALQTAINAAASAGQGFYITQPHGIDTTGLTIPSNSNIRFVGAGALKLAGTNGGTYTSDSHNMLLLNGVSNVVIENARLYGSKELNTLTSGEYGMGINISGACSGIILDSPMIYDNWGDGLYMGSGNSSNVEIYGMRIHNSRRNGISIISSNGLNMVDTEVYNIIDTNPKAAMDFEPNQNSDLLKNIRIVGFKSIRCQNGIAFSFQNVPGATAQVVDIIISDFEDYFCRDSAISTYNLAKGTNSVSGNIAFNNPIYVHSNNVRDTAGWDNSVTVTITNATTIA